MPQYPRSKNPEDFIRDCTARNDAFALLQGLSIWLRRGGAKKAHARVLQITAILKSDPQLCTQTASVLCRWLYGLRLYPLFISEGIFSRRGFAREMIDRVYEKYNPSYKDPNDLRDVFARLFAGVSDLRWLNAVPPAEWMRLFTLLRTHTPETMRETARTYLRQEGFHAMEMLSIWIAAEALEPNLIRIDPKLLDLDSPFVAFKRETAWWLRAKENNEPFDSRQLTVMFDQCRKLIATLRKKGAGAGSSMNTAHLLERLDQMFDRLVLLYAVFTPEHPRPKRVLLLAGTLADAAVEQKGVKHLWRRSVKMLSRSIVQNAGDHGEHYITRTRKEYMGMLRSAAGGGVLIALMSLYKIYLGRHIANPLLYGIASGLNYGIGFALIFILHFTVATKQPAMTAARFATVVECNEKGEAVDMKLARLLVDVMRSQFAAVAGNVAVAITLAMLIACGYSLINGTPLLTPEEAAYQIKSVNPFGPTLWYAAIAGVWLFCSGIISGFFDNRSDYLNLRMRLRYHPVLSMLLPQKWRIRFADYMHANYGSLMGNLCFGMLLGMTGFVGHALEIPLDIRHVAFSSANVGYAAVAGSTGLWVFLKSVFFVLLIGGVNLWVSFCLTMWVALRSRETKIESWWAIVKCVWRIGRENPVSLVWPQNLPAEHVEAQAAGKEK